MKLFAPFTKVEDQPDGTVYVEGVASSEAVDADGERILASAMKAAIPDYMRFPALREMHQLKAAGKTLAAHTDDEDGRTYVSAKVVDSEAVKKVKQGVYSGFSIGGKALQRNASDRNVIEALSLIEISLVDRPTNPDAVISLWKADTMPEPRPFVKLSELFAKFKKGGLSIDDAENQALNIVKATVPEPVAKAALTGAAKIAADARACAEMCIECGKSCIDGAMTTEWHGYSCAEAVVACISCARACLSCAEALDVEASEKAATAELRKTVNALAGDAEKLTKTAIPPPKETPVEPEKKAVESPKSDAEKAIEKAQHDLDEKLRAAQAGRDQAATAQSASHEALRKALELAEQLKKQKTDDEAQTRQIADAVADLQKKYDAEIAKVAAETEQFGKIAAQATELAQKTNALNEQLVKELADRPKGILKVVPVSKAQDNGTAAPEKEPADPKDPVALMKAVHAGGPSLDLTAHLRAIRKTD